MKNSTIKPIKSLGQNFLNDMNIVRHIVESADLTQEDMVIEVGPGMGAMTGELATYAGLVLAVEIDERLQPVLSVLETIHGNIKVVYDDILKVNIRNLIEEQFAANPQLQRVKIISNLPYYITTPIIMAFLEGDVPYLHSMTFMVQKEVGQRMTATPGGKEYGALSVSVGFFAEGKMLFTVPPHCFNPQPNVDSCVVRLLIRENPPYELENKEYFFKIIKASFCQRRKMLVNSLTNAGYLGITREDVREALASINRNELVRGEVLSPEEFATIANFLLHKSSLRV